VEVSDQLNVPLVPVPNEGKLVETDGAAGDVVSTVNWIQLDQPL
jgi:hypothetical protein